MEQQLDQQAGALLEEALAERGVRCELASGISAINDNTVTLLNGRSIAAARVVLATGVQPNIDRKGQRPSLRARDCGESPDADLRAGHLCHWRVLRN